MATFNTFYALMICCGLFIVLHIVYKYTQKSIMKKLGLPLPSIHLFTILLSYKVLMICIILSLFIIIESVINAARGAINQVNKIKFKFDTRN